MKDDELTDLEERVRDLTKYKEEFEEKFDEATRYNVINSLVCLAHS